jgi:hypothetical protein
VATTGRRRLTLVTALTVASLLMGSTAMSALADRGGNGGGHGNGGGQGNSGHAQVVQDQHDGGNNGGGDSNHANSGNGNADHGNSSVANTSHGNDGDNGNHGDQDNQASATQTADQDAAANMQRDDQNEDLVTPPGRVSEEQRPGLGCGDADDHFGPPGNPDKVCKNPKDNDGDTSASAATIDDTDQSASVDQSASTDESADVDRTDSTVATSDGDN